MRGMNRKLFFSTVMALAALSLSPLSAQESDAADAPAATEELPSVPKALSAKEFMSGDPVDKEALVYLIYQSRSACGICVAEAPAIVAQYAGMKGRGAQLVMINVDATAEAAKKWIDDMGMEFPVTKPNDMGGIPFPYAGKGPLPCMVALSADGRKLDEASGPAVSDLVERWGELVTAEWERKIDATDDEKEKAELKKALAKHKAGLKKAEMAAKKAAKKAERDAKHGKKAKKDKPDKKKAKQH